MKWMIMSLFMTSCLMTNAQSYSDELQYKAYLSSDNSFLLWKQSVNAHQGALDKKPEDDSLRYNLVFAQFGLLNATLRTKDEDTFDEYYDKAVKLTDELIVHNKKWAEPQALLSALYGVKMAYSSIQGMVLGSKSNSLISKAKQLNPNSAFVWKVYANSKFFTPEMFGGDLDEAIESYTRCIQLYEAKPEALKNNWHYLDALAFLGQAYVKRENKVEAIATFEKALKNEPDFYWVKNVLLPKAKALK
jgi:tetratricopeptide (TPR) repeat protein